jgi:hypothetical protein
MSESAENDALTAEERERLTELLHRHLGFYISPLIEDAFAESVEALIEARLEKVIDLADSWQAEVEDDGDGLTPLATVLSELRTVLSNRPIPPGGPDA